MKALSAGRGKGRELAAVIAYALRAEIEEPGQRFDGFPALDLVQRIVRFNIAESFHPFQSGTLSFESSMSLGFFVLRRRLQRFDLFDQGLDIFLGPLVLFAGFPVLGHG